jgi:lipid-A-disaccharide synthase
VDTVRDSAAAADFALVASGSATLEVASAGCPMVVMYQTSKVLWHLVGRWLVRPRYFCLVNLLADRELVPEFVPYFTSIEPIVETVDRLLKDAGDLKKVSNELIDLVEPMTKKKARDETAKIIVDMLHHGF